MLLDVLVISSIGLLLSLYGLFVERKLKADKSYKAVCDISDKMSCTKTFLSPWGKMLGISNVYLGILAYTAMMAIALMDNVQLAFLGACVLCAGSALLAYILFTKVRTFCLLCTSIYVVNLLLLIVTYRHMYM